MNKDYTTEIDRLTHYREMHITFVVYCCLGCDTISLVDRYQHFGGPAASILVPNMNAEYCTEAFLPIP